MERNNSNLTEILIKKFEKDIETQTSKGKKQEILDLFTHFNNLSSEIEIYEIEPILHKACEEGDLELIKICLNKTIRNESKDLVVKIDEINQTASLHQITIYTDKFNIPRTVKHGSTDYLITSVIGSSLVISTIKFAEDSAVETIYSDGLLLRNNRKSYLSEICFPASLKELKKGWCRFAYYLTKITVSPSNKQFKSIDDKYLIGKSDPNNDEFDTLFFGSRKIEEISIPSNIKTISSYAFYGCENLTKFEIPTDSHLQTIESYAFFGCENLTKFEIPTDTHLQTIESFAFYKCKKLTKFEIPIDSHLQKIESYAFAKSNIKEIYFPSSLRELKELWCDDMIELSKIKIEQNCNLQIIEPIAFRSLKIEEILIPSKVSKICHGAFSCCDRLKKIEIPTDSNLQSIEYAAFYKTEIEEIYFPASLIELEDRWCSGLKYLNKIRISPMNGQFILKDDKYLVGKSDQKKDEFDILLFAYRNIKKISIPSNIKIISSCAFQFCRYLTKVEIPTNSNLQKIGKYAFSDSNIEEIFIPSTVLEINDHAFSDCKKLRKIDIQSNSKLQKIGDYAFSGTKIKDIFIPSNVSNLTENVFYFSFRNTIEIIEIAEQSKLDSFPIAYSLKHSNCLIMVPSSLEKFNQLNEPA